MASPVALLLLLGIAVSSASTVNLTLYRVTPRNYTGIAGFDTGDAAGDAFFGLYEKSAPVVCRDFDPATGSSALCGNSPILQIPGFNVYIATKVEADARMGDYAQCNPDPDTGVFVCYVFSGSLPNGSTPEFQCWYNFTGRPEWKTEFADVCKMSECGCDAIFSGLSVGREYTIKSRAFRPRPKPPGGLVGLKEYVGWASGQLSPILNGTWYSTRKAGQCKAGQQIGKDCWWREIEQTRMVNATCVNDNMVRAVQLRQPSCFKGCPRPNDQNSDCWVQCLFETIVGNATKSPPLPPTPKAVIVRAFEQSFESDSPAKGGCPDVLPCPEPCTPPCWAVPHGTPCTAPPPPPAPAPEPEPEPEHYSCETLSQCPSTSYCCPEAKHCLTVAVPTVSCAASGSKCAAGMVCCPLTKLCVTAGAVCTPPPVCGNQSYCGASGQYVVCIEVVKTLAGTVCGAGGANDKCPTGTGVEETCDPLTKLCVVTTAKACALPMVMVNKASINGTQVTASNGVVHIINKVLLYPGFALPAPSPGGLPNPCGADASVTCALTAYDTAISGKSTIRLTGSVNATCCQAAQDFYKAGGHNVSEEVTAAFCFYCATTKNTFLNKTFGWYDVDCNAPPPTPPPPASTCASPQFVDTCAVYEKPVEPACCAAFQAYKGAYATNTLVNGAAAQSTFCSACASSTNIGIAKQRTRACRSGQAPLAANKSLPQASNPCDAPANCSVQAYDTASFSGKRAINLTGALSAACCSATQGFYKDAGASGAPGAATAAFCTSCSNTSNTFVKHTFIWYNVSCSHGPQPPPPPPPAPKPPVSCAVAQFTDTCPTFVSPVQPACCAAFQAYKGAYATNTLVNGAAAQSTFCAACAHSTNIGIEKAVGRLCGGAPTLNSNKSAPQLANPCSAPATCPVLAYDTAESGKSKIALTSGVTPSCCAAAQAFYKQGGHTQNYRITATFCSACKSSANTFITKSFTWYHVDCAGPPIPSMHKPAAKEKHTLRDVLVAIVIAASIVIIFILLCLCCSKSTKDERELTTPIMDSGADWNEGEDARSW